ncbi:MAG: dihydrofolate reductase family protein [Candidatus Polarisedimenticolia bacterium]
MRRLFWQISVTLDGFMEGPGRELDDTARITDPDFDRYASAMLQSIDDIVLGRVTYQLFAAHWPNASGPDAERLNALPKLVFSSTLSRVDWNNSRLAGADVVGEITDLKRQPGRDIALFGSAGLAATLGRYNLIDEYRVLVSPVVLGQGNPMFRRPHPRTPLKLIKAETWSSGTVAMFFSRGQPS